MKCPKCGFEIPDIYDEDEEEEKLSPELQFIDDFIEQQIRKREMAKDFWLGVVN